MQTQPKGGRRGRWKAYRPVIAEHESSLTSPHPPTGVHSHFVFQLVCCSVAFSPSVLIASLLIAYAALAALSNQSTVKDFFFFYDWEALFFVVGVGHG